VRKIAAVYGNGKLALEELIRERNREQKKRHRPPTTVIDYDWIRAEFGFERDDVVPDKRKVQITSLGLRSNGCNAYFVKSTAVHEDLLRRFVDVADILGLAFAGFDFMSDDLRDPSKGFVIDVNSKPDVKMVRDARSQGDGTYFKAGPGSHVSRVVPCWTSTGFYCMCGSPPAKLWPKEDGSNAKYIQEMKREREREKGFWQRLKGN
jgi:hypothetical protein